MPKETKKERIRALLACGQPSWLVALNVGCSVNYVCAMRWFDKRPTYRADHMRYKRMCDEEYRLREQEQQRIYRWNRNKKKAPGISAGG